MATSKTTVAPKNAGSLVSRALGICRLVWDFSESDFFTLIIPNVVFGTFGALAGTHMATGVLPTSAEILHRIPLALAWNWYNVIIFDMANQRSPESIQEDLVNKPWRPIPAKRITSDQTRKALLMLVPVALALNTMLGVWAEGVAFQVFFWYYNDLRGSDEVVRDVALSVAYVIVNSASLRIVLGPDATVSRNGLVWIAMISGMILTTTQMGDLKDQQGDRTRGRKTVPLLVGDGFTRAMIATFGLFWSVVCPYFWGLGVLGYLPPVLLGLMMAARVLVLRTQGADASTWNVWACWTVSLYCLPLGAVLKG